MNSLNVSAVILSWVDTSDENGALQWLPNVAPPGDGVFSCPTLYVGNSTGESIRSLIKANELGSMTVVLDAPSYEAPTYTLISHLQGRKNSTDTILLYTHSEDIPHIMPITFAKAPEIGDGPSIIEENGQFFFTNPEKQPLD